MSTGATLDELRGAAESILGPTDDAIAELGVFGPMPAGVPTPPGSFVDDFSVSVARMNDETSANGYVELVPGIPVADATTLYLTVFADLGMTIGSDSTAQNDSGTLRRVDFDAVADAASPTVYAVEFLDADDDTVRLSFEGPTTADAVAIFDGWSSAMPRPAGGTATRGSLSGQLVRRLGRHHLHVRNRRRGGSPRSGRSGDAGRRAHRRHRPLRRDRHRVRHRRPGDRAHLRLGGDIERHRRGHQ